MELSFFKKQQIEKMCKKADKLLNEDNWKEAIDWYLRLIDILPDNKTEYEAYNWSNITIGDIYFLNGEYKNAINYLLKAYNNNDESSFLCLRIGQTYYELNQIGKAESFLVKAFDTEGKEIFYDEDSKYLKLAIKNKVTEDKKTKWFDLPDEYDYLEKEYFSYDTLYLDGNWKIIYDKKISLLSEIPDCLQNNQINWFIINDLLEASVFLKKIDELDEWFEKLLQVSKGRADIASRLVWSAIIEIEKGNVTEGKDRLKNVVKNYGVKFVKNFYHLNNNVYNFYINKIDKIC